MFDDFKFGRPLPTRHGIAQGTAAENRLLNGVGGPGGIRTKIVQNPDGSETMLRTRGGFPEFTTTRKSRPPAINRTFVFRTIGNALAVIANRLGAGMKVLVRSFPIGDVSYFVSAVATDRQGNWRDVSRLDTGHSKTRLNGKDTLVTAPTRRGASQLPLCLNGLIFTAYGAESEGPIAYKAESDGTEAISCTPAGAVFDYHQGGSAGVRISNGDFVFYWSYCTFNAYNFVDQVVTAWSIIRPSPTSPFLEEIAHNRTTGPAFETPHVITSITDLEGTRAVAVSLQETWAGVYVDSDLGITVTPAESGAMTYTVDILDRFSGSAIYVDSALSGGLETSVTINSTLLGKLADIRLVQTADMSVDWTTAQMGNTTYLMPPAVRAEGTNTIAYAGYARDYIYADIDEDVFLTFEVEATQSRSFSLSLGGDGYPACVGTMGAGTLKVQYVLSVRGTKHFFVVYDGPGEAYDTALYAGEPTRKLIRVAAPHICQAPNFAPRFSSQGNCPFIAYTTKEEQAAGATPEIYLDMALVPRPYMTSTPPSTLTIEFVPLQCHWVAAGVLWDHPISSLNVVDDIASASINGLFGVDVPFRVQFANGVKGPWQSQLGEGFTGNPSMEITRI